MNYDITLKSLCQEIFMLDIKQKIKISNIYIYNLFSCFQKGFYGRNAKHLKELQEADIFKMGKKGNNIYNQILKLLKNQTDVLQSYSQILKKRIYSLARSAFASAK